MVRLMASRQLINVGSAAHSTSLSCGAAAFTLIYSSCALLVAVIGSCAGTALRSEQWVAVLLATAGIVGYELAASARGGGRYFFERLSLRLCHCCTCSTSLHLSLAALAPSTDRESLRHVERCVTGLVRAWFAAV
mgnify:CR=1 FL=1